MGCNGSLLPPCSFICSLCWSKLALSMKWKLKFQRSMLKDSWIYHTIVHFQVFCFWNWSELRIRRSLHLFSMCIELNLIQFESSPSTIAKSKDFRAMNISTSMSQSVETRRCLSLSLFIRNSLKWRGFLTRLSTIISQSIEIWGIQLGQQTRILKLG